MKFILPFFTIIAMLSCTSKVKTEEWTKLIENYTKSAIEVKDYHFNHLQHRNYESPFKTKKYYEAAVQIDTLVKKFLKVAEKASTQEELLIELYKESIDSIQTITKLFELSLDTSYLQIPNAKDLEKYLSLNLILYENEILSVFHNNTNVAIFTWQELDLTVSERQLNDQKVELNIQSEGFQSVPEKYLKVDSIIKDRANVNRGETIEPNYSFFSVYIDSLSPGTYTIYGTVTGFSGDTKLTEKFKKEFKIKTGGNTK